MKRKILSIILAIALIMGNNVGVLASEIGSEVSQEDISDEEYELIIEDGVVTGYTGTPIDVVIPEGITQIGARAFEECSSLKTIEIPEGVTSIGMQAFTYCGLTEIHLPSTITSIDYGAFIGCFDLAIIDIPSSVTYIGGSAFNLTQWLNNRFAESPLCVVNNMLIDVDTSVESVQIPESVVTIGEYAFWSCNNLESIEIPSSVNSIGKYAFAFCENLASVDISENVTVVEGSTFENCYNLVDVYLPENLIEIGAEAFLNCTELENILIPSGVMYIGQQAFYNCSSLVDIELPNGLTEISPYLFMGCSSLSSIVIPENVVEIDVDAFADCANLTRIEILDNVTSINFNVFEGSDNVTIYGKSNSYVEDYAQEWNIPFVSLDGDDDEQLENTYELIIEDGVVTGYTGTPVDVVIPSDVTAIGRYAFDGCTSLNSIEIPSSITNIESGALRGCTSLESIVIPEGVTDIGDDAFANCTNLATIDIPSSVTYIGSMALRGTQWLLDRQSETPWVIVNHILVDATMVDEAVAEVPNGVKAIAGGTFISCCGLAELTLPETITDIWGFAFFNCSSLEKLVIPASVTNMGYGLFQGNTKLTIYGYIGSRAESYAKENNIPFVSIDVEEKVIYVINFNANGGTNLSVSRKEVEENQKLGTLPTVQRAGYTFKGWYTAANGGKKVTANTVITANTSLYAQWEKNIISLKDENVSLKENKYTYDGKEKTPYVTVKVSNQTLKAGTDYKIDYKNNVDAGTATVIVEGKGNYTGTIAKTFTIVAKSIEDAKITLSTKKYNYNSKAKKPSVKVELDGITLENGKDYIISYKNNKNIGKATVTIKGEGNYTGTLTTKFEIKEKKGNNFTEDGYEYKIIESDEVAFVGLENTKIKKVNIPKTVKYGGKTFKVTSIADKALKGNKKVTKVTIGANVSEIGGSAFEGCTKLSTVTIGSKVTKIGDRAFKKCTALTKITVPSKVTTIGKEVFNGCKKLKTITIKSTKLKSVGKNTFKGINSKAKIKVPKSKLSPYKKLLNSKGQGSKVKITK